MKFSKWRPKNLFSKSEKTGGVSKKDGKTFVLRNPLGAVGLKLLLIFFFSILIPVIALGTISYQVSKSVVESKVAQADEQTIHQATEKMDVVFQNLQDITTQFYADTEFLRNLAQLNSSFEGYNRYELLNRIQGRLNTFTNANQNLQGLYLLPTGDRDLVYSGYSTTVDSSYKEAEWYETAIASGGSPVWLPTRVEGYVSDEPVFGVARLLDSHYVLLMEVRPSLLINNLGMLGEGREGSQIVMVDQNNRLVFSRESTDYGQEYEINILDDTEAFRNASSTIMDVNGVDNLVVYKRMSMTGWPIMMLSPMQDLIAETSTISMVMIIIISVAVVIALLIGFYFLKTIGRPLMQLRNLMGQGEKGDLTVRMNFKSRDEIGQVSISFNRMMEQITRLVQQTNQSAAEVLETAGVLLHSSKQTATSAKEIAIATEEIANGASSLAIEAEKGNELTQGIGLQMKQVVTANVEMGSAAADVHQASSQGTAYMGQLIEKTNATEEKTRSMVEKVDKLKESTGSIRKILDVLQNLTKQTNILSLNATIEAARAGAAGKGFMVVADEIRKLADQSKQSIEVVGQITETIQQEIEETVSVLSEAYPLFQEQIMSVKEADVIFKKVQEHMGGFVEQLTAVTDSIQTLEESQMTLHEAMSNVSAVSQQSSATSEEVASLSTEQLSVSDGLVQLSEKLERLSNSLKETLSKFTV
ncbi:methyl-accepting chemotaxis protein [Paenibacillus senegalensis]|uniref:methyl-accepting chemotaxis protein n=1 Tax=Paenibacillus senegalensis TaxID=1465766 RepID=UPI00028A399C|nr:methyl-accepting chemotaxis protein [Paenibacillus senegalensis]